ncbi:MAG: amidohydrolase family protein [Pseudomonadota bacterium]
MPSLSADLILKNGRIATLDDNETIAEAVACWNGRIVTVGSNSDADALAGPGTRTIDVGGKTVIPGIIDSHCHPDAHAINDYLWEDVGPEATDSIEALLNLIDAKTAAMGPGEMFRGQGWNDQKCGGYPTRDELDKAGNGRPVWIGRTDHHIAVVNSATFEHFGVAEDVENPPHGQYDRDPETGKLTGLMREMAAWDLEGLMKQAYSVDDYIAGLKQVFPMYHRHGVTSLHNSLTQQKAVHAYQRMRDAGDLTMRMGIIIDGRDDDMVDGYIGAGIKTGFGDEWIRVVGIEWCPDCSVSGRTAAFYEPYIGEPVPGEPVPNTGMLLYTAEDLIPRVKRAHKAGLRVCVEGLGDRGIDFALDAIEAALEETPRDDHRSRVEHCCNVTPAILDRLTKLEVTDSSATGFMYSLGDAYIANRGGQAMEDMFPHRALIDAGVPAPGHSDANVCSTNPWLVFYSLVNRKTDTGQPFGQTQKISVTEALRTYTTLGAWTGFEEDLKGDIAPGKLADFAILNDDPWSMDTEQLRDMAVAETIVGGKTVFEGS